MKTRTPNKFRHLLIGLLIVSLAILPLLGLHIHLPESHMGTDYHQHHAETHAFHVHVTSHDNIDVEPGHPSDSNEVNLSLEIQLHKILKLLALVGISILLLTFYQVKRVISIRKTYLVPFIAFYEIFVAMRRGPPAH